MEKNNVNIGLIGLGVIGSPIANSLYRYYGEHFFLVADEARREKLTRHKLTINEELFQPEIISSVTNAEEELDLLLVCIKNYHLEKSIDLLRNVISSRTVILPLQNGIYSYEFFCTHFPENIILRGYVQGPNTQKYGSNIKYTNSGTMHIGKTQVDMQERAREVFYLLENAGIDIIWEENIKKMVWKKWMLNVAGNSITALTLADYSYFKNSSDIRELCTQAMHEFLLVAQYENVNLMKSDIDDVIDYYINYKGRKKTSMLEDVLNNRKTENEFLAGDLIRLAEKHKINTPMIRTLYLLIKIREEQYM